MNEKDRLQEIKRKAMAFSQELRETDLEEHIDWLIEQAEKVEQLQQEIEQLNNLVKIKESHEQQANNMVHLLEQQLQQAQAKIERCKEIFKDIRDASSDIFALRKAEQALQALEGLS